MKYWEVIKAIDEGTKDVFVHESGDMLPIGYLKKYADGWTEVKQSVTWQEALEAWAVEGKTIRCKDGENDWLFLGHRSVLKDAAGPIDRFQIKEGTWYIEN